MKLHNIIGLAALPLAFVACQNEEVLTESANRQPVHSLKAGMPETMSSRAQIIFGNEDDERENFTWNANDQFAVYSQSNFDAANPAIFSIVGYSDEFPDSWGDFKTESDALMVGDKVMAIYPANCVDEEGYAKMRTPNMDFVDGSAEEWKDYFANHMYLMATTTLEREISLLHFEHQMAIMRVTYFNGTSQDQQIVNIAMVGSNGAGFNTSRSVSMKDGRQNSGGGTNWIQHNFENAIVPAGESRDFYFLVFGQTDGEYNEDSSINIRVQTKNGGFATSQLMMSTIAAANDGVGYIEKGKRYWFNIMQSAQGLDWAITGAPKITNLPLIAAVEEEFPWMEFIKDENGFVDVYQNFNDLNNIISINLSGKGLTDVSGLEYLGKLEYLNLNHNELTELDVRKLSNLQELLCSENQLTRLVFSENNKLVYLDCSNNPMIYLDVSGCSVLSNLQATSCQLTTLHLSPSLNDIDCSKNQLYQLDLSNLTNLRSLWCSDNRLSELDLKNCAALKFFHADSNQFSELDFSACTLLSELAVAVNRLKTLDISANTALTRLYCHANYLTDLDISANEALVEVRCGYQMSEQGDIQTIFVEVNDQQKANAESLISSSWGNEFVHIGPKVPVNGGTAGGGNFGSGGKF